MDRAAEFLRQREGRKQMAARAAGGEHDGRGVTGAISQADPYLERWQQKGR